MAPPRPPRLHHAPARPGFEPVLSDAREMGAPLSWERFQREFDGLPGGGLNLAWECVERHARGARSRHVALRLRARDGARREFTCAELARANEGCGTTQRIVRAALHEVAPEVAHVELDCAAPLREEVDLDSIDFLRFLTGVHVHVGAEIPESRFEELVSLDDVVCVVEQAARAAAPPESNSRSRAMTTRTDALILDLTEVPQRDLALVGGKNAALGELLRELGAAGVRVPPGFALTTAAYRAHLGEELQSRIADRLAGLDARDVEALREAGAQIRGWIAGQALPDAVATAAREAYRALSERCGEEETDVAVRSSATAEDLPTASFAGQQETFLNVRGFAALERALRDCMASLYTDRAIAYRAERGIPHAAEALSASVQKMVRSDLASAGVAFTLDTESGFPGVVMITGAWGLGEAVIQSRVNPDEFWVHKDTLRAGHAPLRRADADGPRMGQGRSQRPDLRRAGAARDGARPGRPHLPRRDHLPRGGASLRCRHGRRHARAARWPESHRVRRRGRRGPHVRRTPAVPRRARGHLIPSRRRACP